jgi:probable F420-dependent oxidoreductase
MRVDVMTGGRSLADMGRLARATRDAGFAGLVITEAGRTAYLSCAAAALAAPELDLATGVAVAFPRSPMVTAATAWELAEACAGRFRLGLGTQVRAHVTRRYGAEFDPPGPRLEDYVAAVRACLAAFGGAPLDHHGPYYELTLLPPSWAPGPIGVPAPAVDVAAVGPWMLRMAGRVADGVHVHPLNTDTYLRTTVRVEVTAGARSVGKSSDDVAVIVPCFTVVGDTPAERAHWRERARTQVAFYGSTPNYGFIFDQIGFAGVTPAIRERQKAGDLAGMSRVVTDEVLDHFVVEAPWAGLAEALTARYGGVADRVVLYFAAAAYDADPAAFARLGKVAAEVMANTA